VRSGSLGFLWSPYGRVSRRGFWLGYVLTFAVLLTGAYFADQALLKDAPIRLPDVLEPLQWALDVAGGPVTLAVVVLIPWVKTMMVLKRLHDRGFGGLILVWKMVAIIGLCWLALTAHTFIAGDTGMIVEIIAFVIAVLMVLRLMVIVLFLSGQEGENRFGPDPLAKR
jgi:uncharacterized membrane protein YhaH (DUF805 family)